MTTLFHKRNVKIKILCYGVVKLCPWVGILSQSTSEHSGLGTHPENFLVSVVKATAQPWLYSYASTADMCVKCLRWVVPIPCWSSSINNTSRCKYITSISYSLKSKGCQNCITMLVVHAALFTIICLFVWWNNDSKILPQLCPHIFECYQFCFCRHHTGTDFLPDRKAVRYLLKQKPNKRICK